MQVSQKKKKDSHKQINETSLYSKTFSDHLCFSYEQYLTNVLSPDVVWASVGVTVTTVSVTRAASMAPANNPGNATARRDGAGSSATRVSLLRDLLLCRGQSFLFVSH